MSQTKRKRIDNLTGNERLSMEGWADRWIEIGLRTGTADRVKFENAAKLCYAYANLPPPKVIVWVPSPLVMALAAPIAAEIIERLPKANSLAVRGAVDDAVRGAVGDAVSDAVDGAVDGAVSGAVRGAVRRAVGGAVSGAVDGAVRGLKKAIVSRWSNYIGGQLWAGGLWYGGAWTSFFREICGLTLAGDLWEKSKAYEATIESACWWWPHKDFIMVCEHPKEIHREQRAARGWGSHRLHNDSGAAILWDGWGVWAIYGVRVPRRIVEAPQTITLDEINAQTNAEVQRVMIERYGEDRYIVDSGMQPVAKDDRFGDIYLKEVEAGKPLSKIRVTNRSPEPDGSFKIYWLNINPKHYNGDAGRIPQAAVASTWRTKEGGSELFFKRWQDYSPVLET